MPKSNDFHRTSWPAPVNDMSSDELNHIYQEALRAFPDWSMTPVEKRAKCLERLATLLERDRTQLMSLLIHEGGKSIPDALGEVREAADYCHYYAMRARTDFPTYDLPGPTGERNQIRLTGRGVFGCISPWNFPLAIYLGQILAALVSGNCVLRSRRRKHRASRCTFKNFCSKPAFRMMRFTWCPVDPISARRWSICRDLPVLLSPVQLPRAARSILRSLTRKARLFR